MFLNKKKKRLVLLIEKLATRDQIPEYRIEEIKGFIEYNEPVIAFEVLTESILEFMSVLDIDSYQEIVILAKKENYNISKKYYTFLQKIVQ